MGRTPMSRIIPEETGAPFFTARSHESLLRAECEPPFCHPVDLIDAAETVARVKGMASDEVLTKSYSNIARMNKLQRRAARIESREIAEDRHIGRIKCESCSRIIVRRDDEPWGCLRDHECCGDKLV